MIIWEFLIALFSIKSIFTLEEEDTKKQRRREKERESVESWRLEERERGRNKWRSGMLGSSDVSMGIRGGYTLLPSLLNPYDISLDNGAVVHHNPSPFLKHHNYLNLFCYTSPSSVLIYMI